MSKKQKTAINREYRDRLFNFIFGREENRKWTLSLYNAVNGSNHTDASMIRFNTIQDMLYMGMRNDTSFLMTGTINVYEHQSTYNPNMPLRMMDYLSRLYKGYLNDLEISEYEETAVRLPIPKLVVFYNGKKEANDEVILNLSDLFDPKKKEESDVEIRVRMLNINHGKNRELMDNCEPLKEYAWFINKIGENHKKGNDINQSVGMAIDEMPHEYEIRKFLEKHRTEVAGVVAEEYSVEREWERLRKSMEKHARERFFAEGKLEGIKEGEDHLAQLIKALNPDTADFDLALNGTEKDREDLYRKYNIL